MRRERFNFQSNASSLTLHRWSYGIIGRTGRGLTELLNIDATNIDIIVGSLAGCVSSAG